MTENIDKAKLLFNLGQMYFQIKESEDKTAPTIFKKADNFSDTCIQAKELIESQQKEINELRDLIQELRWNNSNKN
jgi:hypothetical protein